MAIPNMPMMAGWVARDSATQYSYRKVCSLVLALGSSLRAIGVPGDGKREFDSSGSHTKARQSSHRCRQSQPQGGLYSKACVDILCGHQVWEQELLLVCVLSPGQSRDIQVKWAYQCELGLLGKSSIRALIWPTQDVHSHLCPWALGHHFRLGLGLCD